MANITNVINVNVNIEGKQAVADNMNLIALFTNERGRVLSENVRTSLYDDIQSVAQDFGTNSKTYAHALVAFSQSPSFINASGKLAICYYRTSAEVEKATPSKLIGGEIDKSRVYENIRNIKDGSFKITINKPADDSDNGEFTCANLDFSNCGNFQEVIAILSNALLEHASVNYDNSRITITNLSTENTSNISFLETCASGSFIGDMLGLTSATGGSITEVKASLQYEAETPLTSLVLSKEQANFKGFVFIPQLRADERRDVASWAQANNTLYYEVFSGSDSLSKQGAPWDITLSGFTNTRALYDKAGDKRLATAYMARMHSVNFNAENTAITMNLKTLSGVTARDYSADEISKAKDTGLDIYTSIKDLPCILSSGQNDFTDNRYNLIAFQDALQTDAFNLLKGSGTKIGQTQAGVDTLVDTCEKTCRRFVNAGVFAAGTWTSTKTFGDLETFNAAISTNGFYVKAGSLSEQSQADRQARKSPPIQIACKLCGAVHSADIIVNLNY